MKHTGIKSPWLASVTNDHHINFFSSKAKIWHVNNPTLVTWKLNSRNEMGRIIIQSLPSNRYYSSTNMPLTLIAVSQIASMFPKHDIRPVLIGLNDKYWDRYKSIMGVAIVLHGLNLVEYVDAECRLRSTLSSKTITNGTSELIERPVIAFLPVDFRRGRLDFSQYINDFSKENIIETIINYSRMIAVEPRWLDDPIIDISNRNLVGINPVYNIR